jgi:DNA-binding NtrC family response regulator
MKTPTVLLILEDVDDLRTYGTALRALGYKVLICASHSEGIKTLESESVDLVIVSQGAQAFEARRVLNHAATLYPRPCVLVVAKQMEVHWFLDALDLGAFDYLENPELQDLLWTIRSRVSPAN